MSAKELIEWAIRIVHASHDPPDSRKCEWPFCKAAYKVLAEIKR